MNSFMRTRFAQIICAELCKYTGIVSASADVFQKVKDDHVFEMIELRVVTSDARIIEKNIPLSEETVRDNPWPVIVSRIAEHLDLPKAVK